MQQQMSQQYYNGQSQLQQQQQPSPMYNVTTTAAPQMSDQSATNPFLNASAYQSMAGSNAVSAVVANPFVISGNVNSAAAQNPFAVSQSTIPRKSTDNPFAAGPSHLAFPTDSNNTTANVTTTNPFLMSSTQPQFGWQ
jgi:hypothetical protein